jgi:hypothetical protein
MVEAAVEVLHGDAVTSRPILPDHNASLAVPVALFALGHHPRCPPTEVSAAEGADLT